MGNASGAMGGGMAKQLCFVVVRFHASFFFLSENYCGNALSQNSKLRGGSSAFRK
jgi:hypothetical protein